MVSELTRAGEISVRPLLSMTSGYQDYWPQDYVFPDLQRAATAQAIMQRWAGKALDVDRARSGSSADLHIAACGNLPNPDAELFTLSYDLVGTGATAPAFSYLRTIEDGNERLVDQTSASWNPLASWLRQSRRYELPPDSIHTPTSSKGVAARCVSTAPSPG